MQEIIYDAIDFVKEPIRLKKKLRKAYTLENIGKAFKKTDMFLTEFNGRVQGTGRLERTREIRMIYVNPKFHRKGLGTLMVKYLETLAKRKGKRRVFIHALYSAKGFYKKLGYKKMKGKIKDTLKMGKKI